jgi:hypothetical protein
MTHTELLARLRILVGNPTTANVPDSTLTDYLNKAYTQIATRWRFHATRVRTQFNTTINTASYALSASDIELFHVWNRTTNRRLQKISQLDLFRFDESTSHATTGEPRYYMRDGNNILLFPTPDAVYSMERYTQQTPALLSGGSDVPAIPATWHELIAFWARWMFWDTFGDLGKAQQAYNAIGVWMQSKPNEFDSEDAGYIHGVEIPELSTPVRRGVNEDFHTSTW